MKTTPKNAVRVRHGETVLTAGDRNAFLYTIKDPVGIHARPAGALVQLAKNYQSAITFSANGKTAKVDGVIAVMSLGVVCGTQVKVEAQGDDAAEAIAALQAYFCENL